MRVLLVEDNPTFLDLLLEICGGLEHSVEVHTAKSLESARDLIDVEHFDFVVLDRQLPSRDDAMDGELEHGTAVYSRLRKTTPGTPICFVTAYDTRDFWYAREEDAITVDVWGSNTPEPLIRTLSKSDVSRLDDLLRHHSGEFESLKKIEFSGASNLDHYERRVLRLFARRSDCRSVDVQHLSGGLSGARVLKVTFKDVTGAISQVCVARIGSHQEVQEEHDAYMQHVVRLPNGTYAAFNGTVEYGAGKKAGIFYTLIADFTSLLKLVQRDESAAVQIVQALQQQSASWTAGRPQSSYSIADLRKGLISDSEFEAHHHEIVGIPWEKFELLPVQVIVAAQHGDMHSENVLVANDAPVLIDYGRVGLATTCLDPLMLELSFLFHPACRLTVGDWPSPEQAAHWADIPGYTAACPYKLFIAAAREWATAVAGGQRALYANVYAVAVRQLKFPTTDRLLIRALVEMCLRKVESEM